MYLKIKINNTEADYARFTVYGDEVNTPYVLNRQEENDEVIFTETIQDVDPTQPFLEYALTVENDSCPEKVEYSDILDLTNLIDGSGSFNVYGL